jgi:hypothetical protein
MKNHVVLSVATLALMTTAVLSAKQQPLRPEVVRLGSAAVDPMPDPPDSAWRDSLRAPRDSTRRDSTFRDTTGVDSTKQPLPQPTPKKPRPMKPRR